MSSRRECRSPFAVIRTYAPSAPMKLTVRPRQLQTGKGAGADAYSGMLDCLKKIIRNEGFVCRPRLNPAPG